MRKNLYISSILICILFSYLHSQNDDKTIASNGKINGIPLSEYSERRNKIVAAMDSNSIAVFPAATVKQRNGDVDYTFRQDDALWYLAGFPEDRSVLLLTKNKIVIDSIPTHEILFVKERNPFFEAWTGAIIGDQAAKTEYAVKAVKPLKDLKNFIDSLLPGIKILYYVPNSPAIIRDPVTMFTINPDKDIKKDLTQRFPGIKMKSILGAVANLRGIKSESEIALIQKAIDATVNAHIEAMKSCIPDMYEYELQAVIEYCFRKSGSEYTGFPSIVGSGPNSCILHYETNNRQMKNGDVVVMDIGAEYDGYSADVTRTIPVNGKFSPEQKEIYSIVLQAQETAIEQMKPGVKFNTIQETASKVIADAGYGNFLTHGVSHHIGLDVHDVGSMTMLQPGMVVTIEPGIYIKEGSNVDKKYWNIGIRIEDDVLITKTGNIILSAQAPRSIDEIETLMKKDGIGNLQVGKK